MPAVRSRWRRRASTTPAAPAVASMAVSRPRFERRRHAQRQQRLQRRCRPLRQHARKAAGGQPEHRHRGRPGQPDGTLTSDTDAALSVGGHLFNAGGTVSSAGALTAQVAGAAVNTAGGSIGAATDLSVRAGSLSNAGAMRGGNDATLAIAGALVNDGAITAGRHTAITAGSLQGGSTSVLGAGIRADGSLATAGSLSVTTTNALAPSGTTLQPAMPRCKAPASTSRAAGPARRTSPSRPPKATSAPPRHRGCIRRAQPSRPTASRARPW